MNYLVLFPLLYLCIGLALSKSGVERFINIRWYASALLTYIFIPIVIIYNIAFHERGVFSIMIAVAIIMAIMLYGSLKTTKNPITSLCFSYLNIGWLGLPVAISLFGDQAATVMIAAYVGSSIFGNSVGMGVLVGERILLNQLSKTLFSPSVISLFIGLLIMPYGNSIKEYLEYPYDISKIMMSILGMGILGIWMGHSKISLHDFLNSIKFTLLRVGIFSALVSGLVLYGYIYDVGLITDNIATLYFIGLLPPAINIIVLETCYLKTGKSAPIIATGTVASVVAIFLYAIFVRLIF